MLQVFIITWFGQIISLVGSGLTGFTLGLWVYQRTGSATQFALISFFATLPGIILSPIAGALIDRWERRWTMIISDCTAGLATLFIVLLLYANQLNIWQIYAAMCVISICTAFQYPAYSAAVTLLVPKQHLGRASGMVQIGEGLAQIGSPALAVILVSIIKIEGVLLIDFASYLFALATLLTIKFPQPNTSSEGYLSKGSLKSEAAYGWTYIVSRPSLLGLLVFFAGSNFLVGTVSVLITPMLLAFVSSTTLGLVLSIAGSGMLVGSIVMSVWGGPKQCILGVLGFSFLQGVCVICAGLRPDISLIAAAGFGGFFCSPLINGCSQAIWQRKVPPDLQGRVLVIGRNSVMTND